MLFRKPKKPEDDVNNRKYPRITARNLVRISRADGSPIEKLSNIFDLSEGGLRLICHEHFPPGTTLNIQLNLPERNLTIAVNGRIAWIRPVKEQKGAYFAGVQFTNLMETDRQLLREMSQGGAL